MSLSNARYILHNPRRFARRKLVDAAIYILSRHNITGADYDTAISYLA